METNTAHDQLLSLKVVAQRLNLSLRGVYRLIARGILPRPVKIGGSTKLFESDLRAYLDFLRDQRT
jgi:excisionase family DNA binding protein